VVVLLFVGYDFDDCVGWIYSYDVIGGCYIEYYYYLVGLGVILLAC